MLVGVLAAVSLALPAVGGAAPARVPAPLILHVVNTGCPGEPSASCADPPNATIYLSAYASKFVRAHEAGHLFDYQRLTDADRADLAPLLKARGPWAAGTGELFADAYAACALGRRPTGLWTVAYGYAPTDKQHARVCQRIRAL